MQNCSVTHERVNLPVASTKCVVDLVSGFVRLKIQVNDHFNHLTSGNYTMLNT